MSLVLALPAGLNVAAVTATQPARAAVTITVTPRPEPPGYYKNAVVYKGDSPPLPVTHPRIHTVLAGGTPEWKMILIAAAAALLGATLMRLLDGPALPGRPRPDDPQPTAHPADPSRDRPDSDYRPPLPGVQSARLPARTGPQLARLSRHQPPPLSPQREHSQPPRPRSHPEPATAPGQGPG